MSSVVFVFSLGLVAQHARSQASCVQTLPAPLVTFCAGSPARADDVNGNFNQVVSWVQQKVGTLGSAAITTTAVQTGTLTVNGTLSLAAGGHSTGIVTTSETGYTTCQSIMNFRDASASQNILLSASLYTNSSCSVSAMAPHECHMYCAASHFLNNNGAAGCCGVYPYYTNGIVRALHIK